MPKYSTKQWPYRVVCAKSTPLGRCRHLADSGPTRESAQQKKREWTRQIEATLTDFVRKNTIATSFFHPPPAKHHETTSVIRRDCTEDEKKMEFDLCQTFITHFADITYLLDDENPFFSHRVYARTSNYPAHVHLFTFISWSPFRETPNREERTITTRVQKGGLVHFASSPV